PSFERAWRLQAARRSGRSVPGTASDPKPLLYGDVASLGEQLERLYELVPRERVLVVTYDDFRTDPASEYERALRFLGLGPDDRTEFQRVNTGQQLRIPLAARALHWARTLKQHLGLRRSLGVWSLASPLLSRQEVRAAIEPELRREMAEYFRDDVRKLGELLGRDLSHWARASETS
ncbi:MAG TPA: sulfotransferase domain-containing protein, partial [Candidatus Limnocylindrales bacterium]|nr:sulfotransferase domain-containing protein [Candidatus Limnocylindrales bacterium]